MRHESESQREIELQRGRDTSTCMGNSHVTNERDPMHGTSENIASDWADDGWATQRW
jgi:hypothetical protein